MPVMPRRFRGHVPAVAIVLVWLFTVDGVAQTPPESTEPAADASDGWRMGPVDWIRAGILMGPQSDPEPSVYLGMKLSLCGLDWQHFYLIPFQFTFGGSAQLDGGNVPVYLDSMWAAEVGYMHRWTRDEFRLGVAVGYTLGGGYWKDEELEGAGIRPTVRYRHYWGRVGLEVSLEWPIVIGEAILWSIENAESRRGYKTWLGYPLVGVTVGM